ncbi:MAG: site-specific DNA-methyltransferase [Gemmatimonadaceae bacterium]
MTRKQKLELTWVGKDDRPRLEPRILLEDPVRSYHAAKRVSEQDRFDNRLIFGDNLLALKALEQEFAGKVKCVFIDPPYNTGSAFEHYDDGIEHSLWLSMMRERLEILRRLMTDEGTLWISIDDNEAHYLKVMCDEIFGRTNFVASIVWERTTSSRNDAQYFSSSHDYVLVYARDKAVLRLNGLPRTAASNAAYSNPDSDPRGPWREGDYKCAKSADERPNLYYAIEHPVTGAEVWPRTTRVWAFGKDEHERHKRENLLWWGRTGNYSLPKLKRFRFEAPNELVPATLWSSADVDQTRTAKAEMKALFPMDPFQTPKPERLLQRIVGLATNPGDLVLDSFAGSGTTGAVAHKMGRRWIMVELGEHCHTHIIPRLRKVIDGDDPGGITAAANWKGGGGFRYYHLAPSLLERDQWGNWVISRQYNPAMLAEAVCKIEGFRYEPSTELYWIHGRSSETDYCWVTTQELSASQLQAISDDVGPHRTLLVCCSAWLGDESAWPNLTLRKIPNAVLARCEFGKDDYSLTISQLPEPEAAQPDADEHVTVERAGQSSPRKPRNRRKEKPDPEALDLLDEA